MSRSIRRAGAGIAPAAAKGRANLCENIYFMGSASKTPHMQGGFASLFDATPAQCVKVPRHVRLSGGGARRAAGRQPACCGARWRYQRQERHPVRRRPDRPADHARGKARGLRRDHRRRHCRGAARLRQELGADRTIDLSGGDAELQGARRRQRPSTSPSRFPVRRPALPRRSPASGAAARSFRSAISRAATSPCRPMPSWPRRST